MDDQAFLGKGWRFPLQLDGAGSIEMSHYAQAVRQSIELIIGTRLGERVMRPDFGCRVHDMVFALNNAETIGVIVNEVRRALVLWEPRIDLVHITAERGAELPSQLILRIDYRLRIDNSRFNLVYPFYLEGTS
ncbi:MAG: GPW/gp25 family protein [Anaerolineae bacterium]|jgi:hypothetical protein|nr:GPW/gp25 family protein [Anaerolineae bacterium]